MLPEIIKGWQKRQTICTSIGIQATVSTNTAITFTADDKKCGNHQTLTLDRTTRIPDEICKTLSIQRRTRIWKKDARDRAYDPSKPSSLLPFGSENPRINAQPKVSIRAPSPKKAKIIVEADSASPFLPRESISTRLIRAFNVDIDATPRFKERTESIFNYK